VRSGAVAAGDRGRAAQVRLLSLRRGHPDVHRRAIRLDGRHPGAGDHRAAVAAGARAGAPGRGGSVDHLAAEVRNADAGGAAVGFSISEEETAWARCTAARVAHGGWESGAWRSWSWRAAGPSWRRPPGG